MQHFREIAFADLDTRMARTFQERNPDEVAHFSDDGLKAAVTEARQQAFALGITQPHLRKRFIMLGVFRLPRFWENPDLARMLALPTGTPDGRFEDVCALIKQSALRAGLPSHIWW